MKKLLALLLCLMMITVLVPAMAEQPQVLTVATWDATVTPYLTTQKEAYEASHPGVTIEFVDVASQEYAQKTTAMLSGGDTTDIFDVKELSDLQNWITQGFVENLDAYIADSGYDMTKYTGMESCYQSLEGEQYGLPYRSDFWVLFYNKDLFDAAGIAYPTNDMTWEEYKDLALAISSGEEGVDKVYGTHYHTWLSAVANWAVCDGVNTLADGEYSDLAYFYQLVQDLEDAGAAMEFSELKASGLHYRGAFENGDIAMIPMGYWLVSALIKEMADGTVEEPFNWGIVSVPHLEGVAAGSSFGSPTGVAINANSKQKDLAWDFISWRCSEEGGIATANTGARPAYASEAVADVLSAVEGFPTDEASKAALLPVSVYLEWPTGELVPEIKTIVNEEHTSIMVRDVTIEEGIENMNTRVAELAQ